MSLGVYSTLSQVLDPKQEGLSGAGSMLNAASSAPVYAFTAPRWGKPLFFAGHRFEGPDGQAYELVVDVWPGDRLSPTQFEAIGGAPKPVPGRDMPAWFSDAIADFTTSSQGR